MSVKKILIIDDDEDLLFVLEERLTLEGYDVVSEVNGVKAIAMAKTQQPDLIILDVQMPIMEGGEVARRLKADPATQNIPILYLTCLLSNEESAQMKHDCGGSLMLSKSIDAKELISVIKNMVLKG